MDIIGQETTVISLANAGNNAAAKINPKLGALGNIDLRVVGELVEPVTGDAPLLDPTLVKDGAHEGLVPLTDSQSVAMPVVQVYQPLVTGPSFEGVDDDVLLGHHVEGTLGVQEEEEDRLLG